MQIQSQTRTQKIISELSTRVGNEELSRSELGKMLTKIYHQHTENKPNNSEEKPKKNNDCDKETEIKKNRELTKYNVFLADNMGIMKEKYPYLKPKDLMKKSAELWSMEKEWMNDI